MTKTGLSKFVEDNKIEWHRQYNDGTPDVIMFPSYTEANELVNMARPDPENGGMPAKLRETYLCVWMRDICEAHGIDVFHVFTGEEY